jgi:hypothetical protein
MRAPLMRFNKNARIAGTCVLLGIVGSAAAAPWSSGASSDPRASGAAVTESYAVLEGQASDRDENFARTSTWLAEIAADKPELGLRSDGARIVASPWSHTLAVVPARVVPCLVDGYGEPGSSIACGTEAHPVTAMVNFGAALGVVPDSVESVAFEMTDGSILTRPVDANIWRAPAEASRVHFAVGGKSLSVELMPLSHRPEGAVTDADGVTTIRRDQEQDGGS